MKEEGTGWAVLVSQDTVLYFIHITLSAKSSISAAYPLLNGLRSHSAVIEVKPDRP